MGARGRHQRLRHRQHGRGARDDTRTSPAERERYREESDVLPQPLAGLREPVRPARSGFFQGRDATRATGRRRPTEYDPRVLAPGRRLHRDRRLELRVPRAAGRPGPREPLRRPRRSWRRSSTQFFATPGDRRSSPAPTAARSTRCSRRATCAWGSGALSNQVSHHIPYMYDYAGAAVQDARRSCARRCGGSTRAARSAQGYPGDEDNGEMSAWYLFSALGLLPAADGQPELRDRLAAVQAGDGAPAERPRPRRQRAAATARATSTCRACGSTAAPYDKSYLRHADLASGGDARLRHGPAALALGDRQRRRAAVDHPGRRGRRTRCATRPARTRATASRPAGRGSAVRRHVGAPRRR